MQQSAAVLGYFRSSLQQILFRLSQLVGTSTFFIATVAEGSFRIAELHSSARPVLESVALNVFDLVGTGIVGGRQPVMISDATANPLANPLVEQGIRSYLSVPIRLSDGSLYGTLCTAHPEPYEFTETEVQSMELVATILAYIVELEQAATRDPLTGAYNRLFLQRHGRGLQSEFGDAFALLFIDLDGFKRVNDEYGHDCGDSVLQLAVQRLRQRVRAGDFVVRVGGDEFVVILANVSGGVAGVEKAIERLREALGVEYMVGTHRLRIPASLGVSFYPRDGRDFESLMQAADHAMYQAKGLRAEGPSPDLNGARTAPQIIFGVGRRQNDGARGEQRREGERA